MAAAPQWAEVAKGILAIAQAVAIVLGAAWAYFKFVRGRTFAERLEVSVNAASFKLRNAVALRIRAVMTNTGSAIVKLDDDVKVVYLYGATMTDATLGVRVDWGQHLVLSRVFTVHKWIEAQETVSDELLVTVPDTPLLAYRVELIVASKKHKRWGATAIVPAPDVEGGEEMPEMPQMPLTPEEQERFRQDLEDQDRKDEEARKEAEKQERIEREALNQSDSET